MFSELVSGLPETGPKNVYITVKPDVPEVVAAPVPEKQVQKTSKFMVYAIGILIFVTVIMAMVLVFKFRSSSNDTAKVLDGPYMNPDMQNSLYETKAKKLTGHEGHVRASSGPQMQNKLAPAHLVPSASMPVVPIGPMPKVQTVPTGPPMPTVPFQKSSEQQQQANGLVEVIVHITGPLPFYEDQENSGHEDKFSDNDPRIAQMIKDREASLQTAGLQLPPGTS